MRKISTLNELKKFLFESVPENNEAATQERMATRASMLDEEDDVTGDEPEEKSKTQAAEEEDAMTLNPGGEEREITIDMVIDQVNVIRSGKSLKDPVVMANFDQYFNDLKDAEKVALFAFLKGISQVLTGEISGQEAEQPHKSPADVSMKKMRKVVLKTSVVKKGEATTSPEQSAPPPSTPISAKAKK